MAITTATTPFNLPIEIFCDHVLPYLPNSAIPSIRITSKEAKKCIDDMLKLKYPTITLNGKAVILFEGEFQNVVRAFYQYRTTMSAFHRDSLLLTELESMRVILQSKQTPSPYTTRDFITLASSETQIKESLSRRRKISLALVPFDLESKNLCSFDTCPIGLTKAIVAAVQTDDIELVNLVFFHPNAKMLKCYDLEVALNCKKPPDPQIRLAILAHPNAKSLREKKERRLFRALMKMLNKKFLSLEEYFKVFSLLHPKTQHKLFKRLCKQFGSPTNDFMKDGIKHLQTNPRYLLKVIRNQG